MPRKPPSVETTEGRQAIVDWMRFDADDSCKYPYSAGHWLSLYLHRQPINTLVALLPATQQIERGEWPDDDAALLEWWNTEGKQTYRDTAPPPKVVRSGPNFYWSTLPDTPPTYSFQKYVERGTTREEKIEHLLS